MRVAVLILDTVDEDARAAGLLVGETRIQSTGCGSQLESGCRMGCANYPHMAVRSLASEHLKTSIEVENPDSLPEIAAWPKSSVFNAGSKAGREPSTRTIFGGAEE
jgi:hypothetical protein